VRLESDREHTQKKREGENHEVTLYGRSGQAGPLMER
jgi:hypothetical protein